MKKSFLLGVAVASFSFSAFAQTGNATFYPPANLDNIKSSTQENTGVNVGTSSPGISTMDNGIGNGAPDLSALQAQSIAAAQELSKPVDLRSTPAGAADILQMGSSALQALDVKELQNQGQTSFQQNVVPKEFIIQNPIQPVVAASNKPSVNPSLIKVVDKPKGDINLTDISGWNKSSIEQFEKEGKARTEARYKEFLTK
jgi:hypothetical protein